MSKKEIQKIQTKAISPLDEVRNNLVKMESQFLKVLPPNVTPQKFTRIIFTALQKTPKLLQCDRQSVYSAAMMAAQDGLLPDGRDGVIIPYKNEAKWLPMVGGILKKVYNTRELASLSCHVVYSNDNFSYFIDETGEHIKHLPLLMGDRGEPCGVYAIARLTNGGIFSEVMTADQIEKIRQKSPSKDSSDSPWRNWPDEMWRKSAIKRLAKKLPMSTEMFETIERDEYLYEEEKEVEKVKEEKTKSSRLAKIIGEGNSSDCEQVVSESKSQIKNNKEQDEAPVDQGPLFDDNIEFP